MYVCVSIFEWMLACELKGYYHAHRVNVLVEVVLCNAIKTKLNVFMTFFPFAFFFWTFFLKNLLRSSRCGFASFCVACQVLKGFVVWFLLCKTFRNETSYNKRCHHWTCENPKCRNLFHNLGQVIWHHRYSLSSDYILSSHCFLINVIFPSLRCIESNMKFICLQAH